MYETSRSHTLTSAPTPRFHGGRRTLTSVVTIIGMLATATLAARAFRRAPAQAHEARPSAVHQLLAYLDKKPCDRPRIVSLGERLAQERQYDALVTRADAFTKACGPYPRLQWLTYHAHRQRGDWTAAAKVASDLIDADPQDADYWWWRGEAHERQNALEDAARDYREAMARMPWFDHVPFSLAGVLERLDRPCEAIVPLRQYLEAHPTERKAAQARIAALRRRGHGCNNVARHDRLPARRAR